jgi:hypothetical protein
MKRWIRGLFSLALALLAFVLPVYGDGGSTTGGEGGVIVLPGGRTGGGNLNGGNTGPRLTVSRNDLGPGVVLRLPDNMQPRAWSFVTVDGNHPVLMTTTDGYLAFPGVALVSIRNLGARQLTCRLLAVNGNELLVTIEFTASGGCTVTAY